MVLSPRGAVALVGRITRVPLLCRAGRRAAARPTLLPCCAYGQVDAPRYAELDLGR
jgi:hypothetical protein